MKRIFDSVFVQAAFLGAGGILLFFICLTIVFSGRRHILIDPAGFDWRWFDLGIFLNELIVPLIAVLMGFFIFVLTRFFIQKGR